MLSYNKMGFILALSLLCIGFFVLLFNFQWGGGILMASTLLFFLTRNTGIVFQDPMAILMELRKRIRKPSQPGQISVYFRKNMTFQISVGLQREPFTLILLVESIPFPLDEIKAFLEQQDVALKEANGLIICRKINAERIETIIWELLRFLEPHCQNGYLVSERGISFLPTVERP